LHGIHDLAEMVDVRYRILRGDPKRVAVSIPAGQSSQGIQDGGITTKESVLSTTRFPEAVGPMSLWFIGPVR
jgi:hypothetical protein